MSQMYTDVPCHVCGKMSLQLMPEFAGLYRVSSDCQPAGQGGTLGFCLACATVQKSVDAAYRAECAHIYSRYALYADSNGQEQLVFANGHSEGGVIGRSQALLAGVVADPGLPPTGRLLDVGCGAGNLLAAAAHLLPGWRLVGQDVQDNQRRHIESLPGVENFHLGDVATLSGGFNLITLLHVLEHIPDPLPFLRKLRELLAPGGMLLIQVPDICANPFDLTVVDHCTHYTAQGLARLLLEAGFESIQRTQNSVPKELTALARPRDARAAKIILAAPKVAVETVRLAVAARMNWLQDVRNAASEAAKCGPLGLFGTAIAATWLAQSLRDVAFFVDENPSRQGRPHLGRPVCSPTEAPIGSAIFLPFPRPMAESIKARLGGDVRWILPPAFIEARGAYL